MKRKKSLLKNALIASFLLTTTLLSFAQARTTRVRGGTAYSEEKQNTSTQTAQAEKKPVSQTAQAEKQKATKKNSSEFKLSLQRIDKIKGCIDNYNNGNLNDKEIVNKIKKEIAEFVPLIPTKKLKKVDTASLQSEAKRVLEQEYGTSKDVSQKLEEKAKARYPLYKIGDRVDLDYYVGSRHYSVKGKLIQITQKSITVDDKKINLMDLDEDNLAKLDSKMNQAARARFIRNQTSIENQYKTEREKELLKQLRTDFIQQNENAGYIYDSKRSAWCTAQEIAEYYIENALKRKEQEQKRKTEEQEKQYEEGMIAYQQSNYKTAVELFLDSVDKGSIKACYRLGVCYLKGNGVAVDQKEADKYFKKAKDGLNDSLEDKDPEQKYILAECLFYGYGFKQDYAKALELYKETNWGDESEKNDKIHFCDLLVKAQEGVSDAQFKTAKLFYNGKIVDKNIEEAIKWCEKAALQNNADAQYMLGDFYYSGIGLEKDKEKAEQWYKKAIDSYRIDAEKNDANALYMLGECYFCGKGERDEEEALKWYEKAIKMYLSNLKDDDAEALYRIGRYCDAQATLIAYKPNADRDKMMALQSEALIWYQKAAEQGYPDAQFKYGMHLLDDDDRDYFSLEVTGAHFEESEGMKWIRKAAEQGHVDSQSYLGACLFEGDYIKSNRNEAFKWLRKAADADEVAQFYLARCYLNGIGTAKDIKEARYWYQKATNGGDPKKKKNLEMLTGITINEFQ